MRSSVQYSWWKLLEMVAWPLICLFVLAGLLLLWRLLSRSLWLLTAGGSRSGNSPFARVFPPSPPPQLVTAHGERDRVLKQSFSVDKIPDSRTPSSLVSRTVFHTLACDFASHAEGVNTKAAQNEWQVIGQRL